MGSIHEKMLDDGAPTVAAHTAPAKASKKADNERPKHVHPKRFHTEVSMDQDNRRVCQVVQSEPATYLYGCPLCALEDAERKSGEPLVKEEDFDKTIFLVPHLDFSREVCSLYIQKRYPGAVILSAIQPEVLAAVRDVQIVIVTRKPRKNAIELAPSHETLLNAKEEWIQKPVPVADFLDEVTESAPLLVSDGVSTTSATMFSGASIDLDVLKSRMCDLAAPFFYIADYVRGGGQGPHPSPIQRVFELRAL